LRLNLGVRLLSRFLVQHPLLVAIVSAAGMALAAGTLGAQQPRALSIDVSLGGGAGLGGGELAERSGIALDALVAGPLHSARTHPRMIGVAVGVQSSIAFGDRCQLGGSGQCLDEFPALATVGLLAGSEFRRAGASPGATLRLLAGPAYVHLDGHSSAERRSTVGVQGRADLATAPLGPVAMVLSLRSTLIPRVQKQTLGAWVLAVGLRLR
jgi:hypothetical protein